MDRQDRIDERREREAAELLGNPAPPRLDKYLMKADAADRGPLSGLEASLTDPDGGRSLTHAIGGPSLMSESLLVDCRRTTARRLGAEVRGDGAPVSDWFVVWRTFCLDYRLDSFDEEIADS